MQSSSKQLRQSKTQYDTNQFNASGGGGGADMDVQMRMDVDYNNINRKY